MVEYDATLLIDPEDSEDRFGDDEQDRAVNGMLDGFDVDYVPSWEVGR